MNSLCTVHEYSTVLEVLEIEIVSNSEFVVESFRDAVNFDSPIFTSTVRTDKKAKLLGKTYNLFKKIFKNRETIIFFCYIRIL